MVNRGQTFEEAIPPAVTYSRADGELWVIGLRGHLDPEELGTVEDATEEALRRCSGPLVFDLREVGFCDSSLLNHLLRTARRRSVGIFGGDGTVRRLLDLTGVDRLLPPHPDLESARAALSVRPRQARP
ncbi:STAS domain-containing protein [Streptomyces sp. NPDC085596]|uniref:STAS domain-containing protein n=1 Tax=Streptomyces sp. NPDC085596 TaxID=3365731 RepID=UPI0037CD4D08